MSITVTIIQNIPIIQAHKLSHYLSARAEGLYVMHTISILRESFM